MYASFSKSDFTSYLRVPFTGYPGKIMSHLSQIIGSRLTFYIGKGKVKFSPLQALEALRVVRG
jgi:hypothetical protein